MWLINRFYGKSNSIVELGFAYNLPPSQKDQTTENLAYLKAFIKYCESYMSTCLTFIIIISYEIRNSKEKQTKGRHIQIANTMELLLKASQRKLTILPTSNLFKKIQILQADLLLKVFG